MTTDDGQPTTTDARCVQREANTGDLAAVRANGFSGVFFFSFFHDLNDLVPNLHLDSLAYQPESEPPSVREHVLPFDLDVIHTRVNYWAGDAGTLLWSACF